MDQERESSFGLHEFLEDVDFPADKTDLIGYAVQLDADEDLIALLDRLPEQEYQGPDEVLRAAGEE